MDVEYKAYKEEEMRAEAQSLLYTQLEEEFDSFTSDYDVYLDYCREFNEPETEFGYGEFVDSEDFDEHRDFMFEHYCAERLDSW